jgi:signal transduction histidine kinase
METEPVHFLLVDDLKENLLSLEAVLRREGLIFIKARSGPEALEALLQYDVALAIVDVQMPEMDGFELAELMRGNERTGRVPIIFLTAGTADRQRRFRGYEAGAVDFLHKPIEPDILRSKAQVFYELYLQRRQLARQRDELKSYAAALEEADRRKDEFLAVLAHELRNPLTPIRYGLDMMRLSPGQQMPVELQTMMDRQLTHLVRLIDDLLDVSRVSRGKIDLRKNPIALQAALQAALEASRPLIESHRHTLRLDIPETPLPLVADLTRIAQVVSNLLNNAAKYTPDGGEIHLSAREDNGHAVIAVSDNGLGIPADMQGRVFDLFTQVEGGIKRSRGGLGIGLALARQLVEMHHGSLTVASEGENQGSTFEVRLPLHQDLAEPAAEEDRPPPVHAPLEILVVDDNVSAAETTGQLLAMLGHQVTLSHDGPSALDQARRLNPHAIILDIGMPGMSGYEVCRQLREDPAFAGTVLIAQTGWGEDRDREDAREAGFDFHLTKPVSADDLSHALAGTLPGKSLAR